MGRGGTHKGSTWKGWVPPSVPMKEKTPRPSKGRSHCVSRVILGCVDSGGLFVLLNTPT